MRGKFILFWFGIERVGGAVWEICDRHRTGHHHKQKALRERKGKTRVRLARRYRPVPVPPRSAGGIRRFAREWGTYHVISAPSRCRGRWGGGSEEGGGRGQKFWLAFRCCWFFACVFLVDRCKSRPHNAHQKWQRIARETRYRYRHTTARAVPPLFVCFLQTPQATSGFFYCASGGLVRRFVDLGLVSILFSHAVSSPSSTLTHNSFRPSLSFSSHHAHAR